MRAAKIFSNNILAGILTENNDGSFTFGYDENYFRSNNYSSISLTLPKTQQEYHSNTLFPFFFNLLSEGLNRSVQSRLHKIDEEDDFGLLMAVTENDVIGAVTFEKVEL